MCYDASYQDLKTDEIEHHYGKVVIKRTDIEPQFQLSAFSRGKLPILTQNHPHQVQMLNWGFVPHFAKDPKEGDKWRNRTYNCRADRLLESLRNRKHNMFRAYSNNPAVILLDGFFEWHTTDKGDKVPYYITMKNRQAFAVGAFTANWSDFAEPERQYTGSTLLTTSANPLLAWIHNKPAGSKDHRMPGILHPADISTWLDEKLSAEERLQLITPYPAETMEAWTVANYKKKATRKGNTPEALEPVNYPLANVPVQLDGESLVA